MGEIFFRSSGGSDGREGAEKCGRWVEKGVGVGPGGTWFVDGCGAADLAPRGGVWSGDVDVLH